MVRLASQEVIRSFILEVVRSAAAEVVRSVTPKEVRSDALKEVRSVSGEVVKSVTSKLVKCSNAVCIKGRNVNKSRHLYLEVTGAWAILERSISLNWREAKFVYIESSLLKLGLFCGSFMLFMSCFVMLSCTSVC